jgi:hypothetical protein
MKTINLIAIIAMTAALAACGKDPAADLGKANAAAAAAKAESNAKTQAQPATPPAEPTMKLELPENRGTRAMDLR